jgi:hypothetical protein
MGSMAQGRTIVPVCDPRSVLEAFARVSTAIEDLGRIGRSPRPPRPPSPASEPTA